MSARSGRDDPVLLAARNAAAAIFREVADQAVHDDDIGRINDEAAFAALGDQLRVTEFLQVERQRRWGDVELLGDLGRGHAFGADLDQQAEDGEAAFLGDGGQGGQYFLGVHGIRFNVSMIIEVSYSKSSPLQAALSAGGWC